MSKEVRRDSKHGGGICVILSKRVVSRPLSALVFALYLMGAYLLGLDIPVVYANPISHESVRSLKHRGDALLKKLSIVHYECMNDSIVFGRKQYVWAFQEKDGFKTLLKSLEQSEHPFTSIEVMGNTFFLRAELAQGEAILIIKRHSHHAYSGSLSLMGMTQEKNEIEPIAWLPHQATVLMDVEQTSTRQFVYLLPFTLAEAKKFLLDKVKQHHWQAHESFGSAFQTWSKDGEQLMYFIDVVDGNSVVYIVKKKVVNQ